MNTRVLIVDDQHEIHTDFQEILSIQKEKSLSDDLADAFLSEDPKNSTPNRFSFQLAHASSGEEAYQLVKAAKAANQPFAVAYIDIRMPPGMDGIETIRRIREFEKNLEIVIMTAYTDRPLPEIITDMELLHKLLYIRKPVAREEIQQITLSLVEKWNVEQEALKQQQQLALSHQRLETVLNATGDAIGMFDDNGKLLFANQPYCQLFGISRHELGQITPDELNARVNARLRKLKLTLPETATHEPFDNVDTILEEIGDTAQEKPRLFYRLEIPVQPSEDGIGGNVVSYRDMSQEFEIQRVNAEVMSLRAQLETTYSFDEIIGKSEKMQHLYTRIQRATEGNITVFIQGESGTGKELVAKAIHYNSPRKAGPFVAINCAAIPEALIESELFGHERGAFTGALTRQIGKFEQANTGTLFLDEIGDMQLPLQAKLLRVLQERQFQRVGGTTNISIDIRILTATSQDLAAAIKNSTFREDLYYRVAGFPITVPPLRERREDIPLLANHFLKKYAEATGKSIRAVSADALHVLMQYDFPGNVRELENTIESAVLLETTDLLQPSSLPWHLLQTILQPATDNTSEAPLILSLDEVERRTLIHALEVTGNNISRAAQALGINRSTLHRKLKKYS